MIELCPWCRADVKPHCKNGHPTCTWVRCPDCGVTIEAQSKRAFDRQSQQIPWPHSQPDDRGAE